MRPPGRLASSLVLLAALAPSTIGYHDCQALLPVDVAGRAYLVVVTVFDPQYYYYVTSYVETNGEADLQRGGTSLLGDTDVCQSSAQPDLMVF